MELSVVIPSSSSGKVFSAAVASVLRQSLFRQGRMEVILVCDGNLPSALVEFPKPWPEHFRILPSVASGANQARTTGWKSSCGEIIFFMDDDVRLISSNHCERLFNRFSEDAEIAILGGTYTSDCDDRWLSRYYNMITRVWLWLYSEPEVKFGARAKVLLGGNAAFRRTCLLNDGFNEVIDYGGTEAELFSRIQLSEKKIILSSEFPVRHALQGGVLALVQKAWLQSRNRARFKFAHDKDSSYLQILRRYWQRGPVARWALLFSSPYLLVGQCAFFWQQMKKGAARWN